MKHAWTDLIAFDVTADLLQRDFVQQAIGACALLALMGGLLGPLIVMRRMSFAVHGASELGVTGAAAALLLGVSVTTGATIASIGAALVFALLGGKNRDRDSVIGVVMAFGLGLGVLFLALYGRTGTGFALLTGQVVSIGLSGVAVVAATTAVIAIVLAVVYRPLLFASVDPRVAASRGVPTTALGLVFAVLLGAAVAQGVQVIGALLVMSLLITPAAAAIRITADPAKVMLLSVIFAEIAAVGGVVLSLAPGLPVSVFVTTLSFLIYVVCRIVGPRFRSRRTVIDA